MMQNYNQHNNQNSISDPALDVLNRALNGDPAALAFLERTSSIYVLDATDPSQPKTYGGWNFIHQAMNEIERREAAVIASSVSIQMEEEDLAGMMTGKMMELLPHVQLLATLAHGVARRSPAKDRSLISICLSNAAATSLQSQQQQQQCSSSSVSSNVHYQRLMDLNSEIREIVMGRIAAMAFDFSFHQSHLRCTGKSPPQSAFSNPIAMEQLCSVLAANAVTTGPKAVHHFMNEWIIPSVATLPPFAVACITYHLPLEAISQSSPVGTKDVLQRLSHPVVGRVLAPVLADAISESSAESQTHSWNARVATICLKALERWCTVTDLSLPQIQHICHKHKSTFVSILSDALYSDSDFVVEAIADLLDTCIEGKTTNCVSENRMTQARYIMEVDEKIFRAITPEDLYRIEAKEMEGLVGELVSAVGLQRFRFGERQFQGDHGICRSLTRIAAKVANAALLGISSGPIPGNGAGLFDLLIKAAAHPHVHISSLSIEVLADMLHLDHSLPSRILPLLQHRAIIPYILINSIPSLSAYATAGVDYCEFEKFRQTVLAEALISCYRQNPKYYMDSCTSAVEEFCSSEATVEVSFQLEAALYCLTTVAISAIGSSKEKGNLSGSHDEQLLRCTMALATKPSFLPANPLTLGQLNRFLGMYGSWFTSQPSTRALEVAFELSLSTIKMSETAFSDDEPASDILKEMECSPFSEAAKAVRIILTRSPGNFTGSQAIATLGSAWETTYIACNRGMLTIEDREEICKGICEVIFAYPKSQRTQPLSAFAIPIINCLHVMTREADSLKSESDIKFNAQIPRLADEIRLLSTIMQTFTTMARKDSTVSHGSGTSSFITPAVGILRQLWPCLTHISTHYASNEVLSDALGFFLVSSTPHDIKSTEQVGLIKELFTLSKSMITTSDSSKAAFLASCDFLERVIDLHGPIMDELNGECAEEMASCDENSDSISDIIDLVKDLLLTIIESTKGTLGTAWTRDIEQMPRQQSYESKPESKNYDESKLTSHEILSSIFGVLTIAAISRPSLLAYLPATSACDIEHDRVLVRAIESAVSVLHDPDFDTARSSILFLKATIEIITRSENGQIKDLVEGFISPVKGAIVTSLTNGICGSFQPTLLDPASSLLYTVLVTLGEGSRWLEETAFLPEKFKLGNEARTSCIKYLTSCCNRDISPEGLMDVAEAIWKLHQNIESDAMALSDQVADFIKTFS